MSQYEVAVLRRIMFWCGSQSQACWESQLSMAKYLEVSRRTGQRPARMAVEGRRCRRVVRWPDGESEVLMFIVGDGTRNLAGNPDSPQAVVFLTSIIDEIVDVSMYYIRYYAI